VKSAFLLIDAGNTRVKWATAHARGPIGVQGQIETGKLTAARIASLSRQFPEHQVVLASVVPKLIPWFRRAFGARLLIVTGKSPALALPFDYPKPAEIGADRLAASVAAHESGHYPAIIVLCGTATAFNVLDAKGRFCGGAIAPGLDAQLTALLGATAQLPKTLLRPTRRYLGRSTQEAIRSGLVLNYIGGVKEILRRLSEALPSRTRPHVILTGGNAHYLTRALDVPATLKPLLVFEGLRIIGLRHFQPKT
jgi:type III pantothenate kinase